MKQSKSILYLCLSVLFTLTACTSAPYALRTVTPQRIEVTKTLDANPIPQVTAFIMPFRAGVDSLEAPYIGQSEQCMAAHRPESLLSNWVADALVATAEREGIKADFGLCNIGGLRAVMPQGTIRRGDILAISPFENFFTTVKLKGTDVQDLMKNIAVVHGEGLSSAVRLVVTISGDVKRATISGQPIDPDRIYTIATLDYLAEGNDKLTALKQAVERNDTKISIRDMLMNHLRLLDQQGKKAHAAIEGRVVIEDYVESAKETKRVVVDAAPQALALKEGAVTKIKELLVVHTNDTHSCIDPLNPNLADTAQANKGGYLRRATLISQLREKDSQLLLLDAGDFSQGSAYYSLYHGDVEVGLMNLMGYDAATIGNHEFDFGLDNMARLFRKAQFPIVCCNYDFSGTPVEGIVKPYTIIKRNGLKIGIFGLSPQPAGLVPAHSYQGVRFIDPIEAAQPVADYLKNEAKCDLVICLSHLGWDVAGISDEELIPATRNIDVVIGGHSHTYFTQPKFLKNLDGAIVPNNQMGKNARFVGTLRLALGK